MLAPMIGQALPADLRTTRRTGVTPPGSPRRAHAAPTERPTITPTRHRALRGDEDTTHARTRLATNAGGGTRSPDTRLMIPPHFGLAIGDFGGSWTRRWTRLRPECAVRLPSPSTPETTAKPSGVLSALALRGFERSARRCCFRTDPGAGRAPVTRGPTLGTRPF